MSAQALMITVPAVTVWVVGWTLLGRWVVHRIGHEPVPLGAPSGEGTA